MPAFAHRGLLAALVLPMLLAGCVKPPTAAEVELYLMRPAGTDSYGFQKIIVNATTLFLRNQSGLGSVHILPVGPYDLMEPRQLVWEGEVPPDAYVSVRILMEDDAWGELSDGRRVNVSFPAGRISNNFDFPVVLEKGERIEIEVTSVVNRQDGDRYVIL